MVNIPESAHRIILPDELSHIRETERVGKVRHTFQLYNQHMLLVASDRISTFDAVHPTAIPGKGKILTQLSAFWFKIVDKLQISHHFITADIDTIIEQYPELAVAREMLDGRTMLTKRATVYPIEAIVRGNLTGSGLKDYRSTGKVCGIELPEGLKASQELDPPIFTPSTKAEEGHDVNISFEAAVQLVLLEVLNHIRDASVALFTHAREYAKQRDIIIADTKLEWGTDTSGNLMLIDEVLTPDSSRFWHAPSFTVGTESPASYDKQYVRDYVANSGWNKEPPAPELPGDVVEATSLLYQRVYDLLTENS